MARMTTVAGMVPELVDRFRNLESGHAAATIYAVWRDICEETEAYRYRLVANSTASDTEYTLTLPDTIGADIQRVYRVFLNGAEVLMGSYDASDLPTLRLPYAAGVAQTGVAPSAAYPYGQGLVVLASLLPWVNDPTGINANLFSRWHACVYEGACERLSKEFPKTYADKDTALMVSKDHGERYESAKAKIRMNSENLNTSAPILMHTPGGFIADFA